jgi:hypothetical protein
VTPDFTGHYSVLLGSTKAKGTPSGLFSTQEQRWKVSFPPDRWPATEVTDPDGTLRFVLKDGTEIHRIGILAEVYDHQTGNLVGHVGPRGRFVPLSADPAGRSCTIERRRFGDPGLLTVLTH